MNYKNIITSCLIFCSLHLFSQTQTEVKPKIKSVTVYRSGALIESEAKTVLKPGINRITLVGNSERVVSQSVQLTGIGNFAIISVKPGTSYLQGSDAANRKREKAALRRDSIQKMLKVLNANLEASRLEETMLISNSNIDGTQTGVNLLEMKQIAVYYAQTLKQIKLRQKQINSKIELLNNEFKIISGDLQQKDASEQWFTKIEVELKAPAQTNATLNLDYFTSDASWSPVYDIRVNDLTGKMNVAYKAQIFQKTGLDWNNVALTVSTGNPMFNNEKPIIKKRFVDAYVKTTSQYNYKSMTGRSAEGIATSMAGVQGNDGQMGSVRGARTDGTITYVDGVSVMKNSTNIDFAIEKPYSIASNNKPYLVEIKKYVFDAQYEIYAAPEWDKSAYLTAQTSGWENNGFEVGMMNIFLAGTFIGTTNFDPNSTTDTLTLSLGKDKSTNIERVRSTDFSKTKLLSNAVEETFAYTIKVKNTRDYPIKVKIEEQIPIAKSDDITVTIVSMEGAKQEKESGILTWALNLKAKETITLKYVYTLKRPKDGKVDLVY